MKSFLNKLNNKITIQNYIAVNNNGSITFEWQTENNSEIWACIQPTSGLIEDNFCKINTKLSHVITIRYLNNISINDRIIYNNRIFYIKYIINVEEKNKYLTIYCEEEVFN